jgi:hypothetical protein
MGSELQTKLLPGLAQMLKMSPQQLQGYLAGNFPAVSAGLASMPAALGRFDALVDVFDESLADYDTAKDTTLLPIAWALLIAGLLVAGLGAYALVEQHAGNVAAGRRERAPLRERLAFTHGHGQPSH